MKQRPFIILIAILFIFSGLASLIYQIVWFKSLSYFLGNSTYSQALVLATFMGGLSLGAYYWGRRADKARNKLKVFAFLEIGIALYCFGYETIFTLAEEGLVFIVNYLELASDGSAVLILKFIVSAFTILIPTVLMGGTLPVLVDFFSNRFSSIGRNVAILYFLNSLGAVFGTLLAGFWMIQSFGLRNTLYAGASLELIIGIIAFFIANNKKIVAPPTIPKRDQKDFKNEVIVTPKEYRITLVIAAFSGLTAMMYEVLWLRLLIPVLSSSTYSFTLILAAFISGITLGSFLVYRYFKRVKNHFKFLGVCQFLIVISVLVILPFYGRLPYYIWSIVENNSSYTFYLVTQFTLVFLMLFIPTVFMGMILPVAGRMAVKSVSKVGSGIGNVFALNTLGTVIGSLLAGLFFIPLIGVLGTFFLVLSINIILTVLVFNEVKTLKRKSMLRGGVLFVLVLLSSLKLSDVASWKYTIMLSEVSRKINRLDPPKNFNEFLRKSKTHDEILFYKEGQNGTFLVAKSKEEVYLFTNGKGDANSVTDLRTQVSLAQTPMILHPKPDSVFVIGFGAGTTIGNVMIHENLKYGVVAEISKEVINASTHFNHVNENPLENQKLNVLNDDGVASLRMSNHKYDIIISQPSNPWSAGVGNLFTADFFKDCKKKLKKNGYLAQWFNLYEMNDKSLKLILRTVLSEFENVSLWHIGKSDVLILCSESSFIFDLTNIEKRFNTVSSNLAKVNIRSFSAFLSQEIVSDRSVLSMYANSGALNTEDQPLLEYWAPSAYFYNDKPEKFYELDERNDILNSNLLFNEFLKRKDSISAQDIVQAGLFQLLGGSKKLSYFLADLNPLIYNMWAKKALDVGDLEKFNEYRKLGDKLLNFDYENNEIKLVKDDVFLKRQLSNDYTKLGSNYLSSNKLKIAGLALKEAIKIDSLNIEAYNILASVYGKSKKYEAVIKLIDLMGSMNLLNARAYFNRGFANMLLDNNIAGIDDFSKSIELMSDNGKSYLMRGQLYVAIEDYDKACEDFKEAFRLGETTAKENINQFCGS